MTNNKKTPFNKVLVANRGEIAVRVLKSAKALGLNTVAVYSEADANAPHVSLADDAVYIGPAPVSDSYLCQDKTIAAAKTKGADAVHPGYGFLSENADFAAACKAAGLVFIGPEPDAIELMGDKAKAKRRMIAAGVPCVPGYEGEDQSNERLLSEAEQIGFPIMVKAAAGGGGRGMRLVENKSGLPDAIQTARSEAENAFGSGDLILERAIVKPRHVEIQIFADRYGAVVHLGERDCSVQRRHQKVLEEAPCPVMTPELRVKMGEAAVKAAKDIDYVGAGTVEFLLDNSGDFFFLEMNTRLQVEHPVTEMITGLDLVALQIHVAQGEPLGFSQKDVKLEGHAIEARLYAEDPGADFLPATGPIDLWAPHQGSGIRIDAGIATGGEVSPYYDPMLAKVISYGANRDEARRKLIEALKQTVIFGVATNKAFLIDALQKPLFVKGAATTNFINESFSENDLKPPFLSDIHAAIASLVLHHLAFEQAHSRAIYSPPALENWASATPISKTYRFANNEEPTDILLTPEGQNTFTAQVNDQTYSLLIKEISEYNGVIEVDGEAVRFQFYVPDKAQAARIQLSISGHKFQLTDLNAVYSSGSSAAGAGDVVAPMHGMLIEVFISAGDKVQKGDRLAILEAMKMQHELTTGIDGVVAEIHRQQGAQVGAGDCLIEITPLDTE